MPVWFINLGVNVPPKVMICDWNSNLPIKQPRRFIMGLLVQGWHIFPSWIAAVSDGFSSQSLSHSCIPKPQVNRTSHPQDWCNMPNKNGTHPQNHPPNKKHMIWLLSYLQLWSRLLNPQKDTARERTKLLNIIWCTLHECSDEIANIILGPWIALILTQLSGAPWSPSIPLTSWLATSRTMSNYSRPSVDRYLCKCMYIIYYINNIYIYIIHLTTYIYSIPMYSMVT